MASESDRRSAERTTTSRRVMFVATDGSTLLQEGQVVDMSSEGLCIRTRRPVDVGKLVDLEIEPREGARLTRPILTRGRVVRVDDIGRGEYHIGVHFRYRCVSASDLRSAPSTRPAALLRAELNPRRAATGDWRAWILAVALLLILGALLLWRPRVFDERPAAPRMSSLETTATPAKRPATREKPRSGNHGETFTPVVGTSDADRELMRSFADPTAAAGTTGAALAPASLRPPHDNARPTETRTAIPALNRAAASAEHREPDSLAATGAPSRSVRDREHARDRQSSAQLLRVTPRMVREQELSGTGNEPYLQPGLHLRVDRSAYTLTVYRDGKPFTAYPVSLGEHGSTPSGVFAIHNKIRNPDWYNRGQQIPYGDPRNPLGDYWIGFAHNGRPLSYGIHPTNDLGALGTDAGRGCVRMKPEHAAALFRLCPIGATVTIE